MNKQEQLPQKEHLKKLCEQYYNNFKYRDDTERVFENKDNLFEMVDQETKDIRLLQWNQDYPELLELGVKIVDVRKYKGKDYKWAFYTQEGLQWTDTTTLKALCRKKATRKGSNKVLR